MKYRILIVDDEDLIRQGIKARFAYLGFDFEEICEAGGAEEALAVVSEKRVDIVLTDIRMPDIDGLTLISKIKELSPLTKFIILSGYAEFKYAEQAIRLGVCSYLLKPVSNDELKRVFEEVIEQIKKENNRNARDEQTVLENEIFSLEKQINNYLIATGGDRTILSEELSERLNLKDNSTCVMLIHIDGNRFQKRTLDYSEVEEIRKELKSRFKELIVESKKVIVNDSLNNNQLIAVISNDNEKNLRRDAGSLATALLNEVWQAGEISLTIGISGVHKGLKPEERKEAVDAFLQRVGYGAGNTYLYDDIGDISGETFPTQKLNSLKQYIEKSDLSNIEYMIREIFPDEGWEKFRFSYVRMIWMRIANDVWRYVGITDSERLCEVDKYLLNMDILEDCRTMQDVRTKIYEVISACIQVDDESSMNTRNKLKFAIKYIEENYNRDISINELAGKFSLSPNYFSSAFRKETGTTTVNYIKNLRLRHAKNYLRETLKSVAEIAGEVGYEDSQYFFKVFKKATGITPLQYRNGDDGTEEQDE